MNDLADAIRLNPRAAEEMARMKEEIDILNKLRESGLARGDCFQPVKGRRNLIELKPQKVEKRGLKLTFRV